MQVKAELGLRHVYTVVVDFFPCMKLLLLPIPASQAAWLPSLTPSVSPLVCGLPRVAFVLSAYYWPEINDTKYQ